MHDRCLVSQPGMPIEFRNLIMPDLQVVGMCSRSSDELQEW